MGLFALEFEYCSSSDVNTAVALVIYLFIYLFVCQNITYNIYSKIPQCSRQYRQADVPHLCWRRGAVVSGVRRMNEVNARRARLLLGWVTVFGRVYRLGI